MIEQDTIKLLRECDAGIKMGVDSINDVLEYVSDRQLKQFLTDSMRDHNELDDELQALLDKYGDEGKSPNPVAKSMSWMKTAVMLKLNESDSTIADLMTDGCNMGVKLSVAISISMLPPMRFLKTSVSGLSNWKKNWACKCAIICEKRAYPIG